MICCVNIKFWLYCSPHTMLAQKRQRQSSARRAQRRQSKLNIDNKLEDSTLTLKHSYYLIDTYPLQPYSQNNIISITTIDIYSAETPTNLSTFHFFIMKMKDITESTTTLAIRSFSTSTISLPNPRSIATCYLVARFFSLGLSKFTLPAMPLPAKFLPAIHSVLFLSSSSPCPQLQQLHLQQHYQQEP